MLINFNELNSASIPNLNGGEGTVTASMFMDGAGKIMKSVLPKGASIGLHTHQGSYELDFVLSGNGKATCDGVEEILTQGACHYCPDGSSHSITNTSNEDLVLLTIVPKLK